MTILPLLAASSPILNEAISSQFPMDELIATEAVGWAFPNGSEQLQNGPEIWFATDLGIYRIEIGPRSVLAQSSLIQLSLNANKLMVMKILKPGRLLDGLAGWHLAHPWSDWETNSVIELEGHRLTDHSENTHFDFTSHDMAFRSLDIFHGIWSPDRIRSHESRLLIACSELEGRNGFTMKVRGISIPIHELDDLASEFSNLKKSGWCPLNVVVDAERQSIGLAILENYDVVLDGMNRRMIVVPKTQITPTTPLMKYRLDPSFPAGDQTSASWRWILSPGRVRRGDFVLMRIDRISYDFRLLCLVQSCYYEIIPQGSESWVGEPAVDILPSGDISVTDTRGWTGYKTNMYRDSNSKFETVRIVISRTGFRMMRDPRTTTRGMKMEFVPVKGPREVGEFSIPEWPPVFDQTSVAISDIDWVAAEELISDNVALYGKPKVEVHEGHKIVITAESSETECDREVQLIVLSARGQYLDFSNEICNYRQIERDEAGYFFERLARSDTSPTDLRFAMQRGAVLLEGSQELYLTSTTQPGGLWSPPARWFGTPAIAMEPNTKSFSITPTGDTFWEYSHVWDVSDMYRVILSFTPLPKRLVFPERLTLTDPVWLFTPAPNGVQNSFTVTRDRWIVKGDNGDFTLVFEGIAGPVFDGLRHGVYIGVPEISFDDSGSLLARSNDDSRILYNVEALLSPEGRLEIIFTLADYAAVGSAPVQAGPADDPCPICMDEYTPGAMIAETRCKHRFHLSCLRRVVDTRCPLCRGSLDLR